MVAVSTAFEPKAMAVAPAANSAVHQDGGRAPAWDPYDVWLNQVREPREKSAAAAIVRAASAIAGQESRQDREMPTRLNARPL